jgi:hypothetical protein
LSTKELVFFIQVDLYKLIRVGKNSVSDSARSLPDVRSA